MSVKLIYSTPLSLISNGCRYSHDNHHLSDTPEAQQDYVESVLGICNEKIKENIIGSKDFDLIKRIGFHANHSSVLEHSLIVFDIKMTTKALLEESRHRVSVSQTVTSSRYALDIIDVEFEEIPDLKKEAFAKKQQKELLEFIDSFRNEKGKISKKDMDELAMLLPQNFIYKMQLTFNLRSLVHFLKLRINKSAHYSIRKIAFQMIDSLPDNYKELILLNEKIRKDYESINTKAE